MSAAAGLEAAGPAGPLARAGVVVTDRLDLPPFVELEPADDLPLAPDPAVGTRTVWWVPGRSTRGDGEVLESVSARPVAPLSVHPMTHGPFKPIEEENESGLRAQTVGETQNA